MVGTTMVVALIKDSVLHCFCQSCPAAAVEKHPIPPVGKVQTTPPKKTVYLATEVRATEHAKGGVRYELVLAEPAVLAPIRQPQSSPKSDLSVEEIAKKLKAAEERRQSLEAEKINQLNEKRTRLQEVNVKRQEYNNNFVENTKNSLELKMEANKENRHAYLKAIQEKGREHDLKVKEVRKSLELQSQELLQNFQKKMEIAAEARVAQIASLQDRLREHDKHIAEVRKQMENQVDQLRDALQKKLDLAQENRESIQKMLQEKLQEHDRHIEEVRQNKAQMNNGDANSSG